jgi:glycerol transport system ATP-binding protein
MEAGELLQYGPTAQVFHYPNSLRVAKAFSDPPMNLLAAVVRSHAGDGAMQVQLPNGAHWDAHFPRAAMRPVASTASTDSMAFIAPASQISIGFRAGDVRLQVQQGGLAWSGVVELAEISGSDTFVHVHSGLGNVVVQLTGVHHFALGERLALSIHPRQMYLFDAQGALLVAPARSSGGAAWHA